MSILSRIRLYPAGNQIGAILSLPTSTQVDDTTATGTVYLKNTSAHKVGGTLYFYTTENAYQTRDEIIDSGQSQAVTDDGNQDVTPTGLTASTTYYIHYAYVAIDGHPSNVVTSASFATTAGGGGQSISVGQVLETDLAQAVTMVPGVTSISVGQASETDLAQSLSIAASIIIAVGIVSETDLAQAVTVSPGAITISVGQVFETDLAQTVTPVQGVQNVAVGQVSETDLAQAVTVSPGAITIAVGQASETDLAQTITPVPTISISVGQVTETDLAQTITPVPGASTIAVGQVFETDLAQAITLASQAYGALTGNAFARFTASQSDVVIRLFDPITGDAIALDDGDCVEIASTGRYVWDASKLTTQPSVDTEYLYEMTDDAYTTIKEGIVLVLGTDATAQIAAIYKRMDLDDTDQNTYADDGSSIVNDEFTLTKTDLGGGEFSVIKTDT